MVGVHCMYLDLQGCDQSLLFGAGRGGDGGGQPGEVPVNKSKGDSNTDLEYF